MSWWAGIGLRSDVAKLKCNIKRVSFGSALKHHMFKKMRNTGFARSFITRSGFNKKAD